MTGYSQAILSEKIRYWRSLFNSTGSFLLNPMHLLAERVTAMSRRISHSLLDPWVGPPLKALYPILKIPAKFPPEGIVLIGHGSAIAAAIGFAFSTQYWWGGLVAGLGVVGNHTADCLDGTHARTTGQCRNGGELLDHFTDPLSFAYYLVGIAVACGRLDLGLVAVICLFAHAVLTNIKAKMTGEFTLATFGPTEFKAMLVCLGFALTATYAFSASWASANDLALAAFVAVIVLGILQLGCQLVLAVREVNDCDSPVDTNEWETARQKDLSPATVPAKLPS